MTKKMCKNNTHRKSEFFLFCLYAVWISNRKRVDVLRFIFFGWKGETSCISYSFSYNFSSWPEGTSGSSRVCVVCCCVVERRRRRRRKKKENWVDEASAKAGARWLPAEFFKWPPIFFFSLSLLFFLSSGSLSLLHFFFYFKGSPQRNIPLFLLRLLHLYQQEEMRGEKFPFFCASLA